MDNTIQNNKLYSDMQKKALQHAIQTLRNLHHELEVCETILDNVENILSTCESYSSKYLLERVKWVKNYTVTKPKGTWAVIDMLCDELEVFINS